MFIHDCLTLAFLTDIKFQSERGDQIPSRLFLAQVKLLNCVGMLYCGDERLLQQGKAYHTDLVSFCNAEWTSPVSHGFSNTNDVNNDWRVWYEAESLRRTGYSIVSGPLNRDYSINCSLVLLLTCPWRFPESLIN